MSLRKIFSRQICIRLTEDQDGFIATEEFAGIRLWALRLALKQITHCKLRFRPFVRVREMPGAVDSKSYQGEVL